MDNLSKKTIGEILIVLILISVIILVIISACSGKVYETNDIADYGTITGNINNSEPTEFVFSFFPPELNKNFSDVSYHYKAKKGDEFAYECYLEFVIEDVSTYNHFVASYTDSTEIMPFLYDEDYMEYSVSNILSLDWTSPNEDCGFPIGYAEIGKILYCDSEQRIIFFALGIWDGGGTDTSEFDYFFKKFNIDVITYQLNAYYSYIDQQRGITYGDRYELEMETPYPYPG